MVGKEIYHSDYQLTVARETHWKKIEIIVLWYEIQGEKKNVSLASDIEG